MITKPVRERLHNQGRRLPKPDQDLLLRIGLVFLLAFLVWVNRGFMIPLAMAALFAVTLYPLAEKLKPRVHSSSLRAGIVTLGFTITFLVPIGIVAFLAADAGLKKVKGMPEDWTGQLDIDVWLDRLTSFLPFERTEILRVLEQAATTVGRTVLSMLQDLVADLPKLTIDNIVIIFGIYVFLHESRRIVFFLRKYSPLERTKTDRLFETVSSLAGSSVLATVVSGFVQSLLIGVMCLAMGVTNTLLIVMTAFVLSFIPIFGTAPVLLYLMATAAFAGEWSRLLFFTIGAAIVSVSDNVVRPYVLSGSAQLHPLIGFVAAFGALETMGFYGLFLGPVLAGAVLMLVELVLERNAA